jgi:hypothetical protein
MKTIRMATVKADQDYTLCSCGAVKLNRFQCFNGCGLVTYPNFDEANFEWSPVFQELIRQQRHELEVYGAVRVTHA